MKTNGKIRCIRITRLHRRDAYYPASGKIVGAIGEFTPSLEQFIPGYFSGNFQPYNPVLASDSGPMYFYGIRYERV